MAPNAIPDICDGVSATSATSLNFTTATVKQNDLQYGGELRYGNIGTIDDAAIDLIVTSTDYSNPNPNANGKDPSGNFGKINCRTMEGDLESGQGTFEFCLVLEDTYTTVTAESFQW